LDGYDLVADSPLTLALLRCEVLLPVKILDHEIPVRICDVSRQAAKIEREECGNLVVPDRLAFEHAEDQRSFVFLAAIEHRPLAKESPPVAHGSIVFGVRKRFGRVLGQQLVAEAEAQAVSFVNVILEVEP
jgi:hypothetical protein